MRSSNRPARAQGRRRRGATLVEFALVAPVVFMFIFGLVEFGRLLMVQQALTNAAREGCREATLATTQNSSDADTVVRNYLQPVIYDASNTSTVRVSLNPASFSGISSGTPITLTVQVDFDDVSWLPGNFLGIMGNPVLRAESIQQRE